MSALQVRGDGSFTTIRENMANVFDSRLNIILKNWVTPCLKKAGFNKQKVQYGQVRGDVIWLIDIQRSRWNDASQAQFTLNCGVHIPGVVSAYANKNEPTKPRIPDCCISSRIGMLTTEKKDLWWRLDFDDNGTVDIQIGKDLLDKIERYIVPFLEKFDGRPEIAEFLSQPLAEDYRYISPQSHAQRLAYSAIVFSLLGDTGRANDVLKEAIDKASGAPIEAIVAGLAAKL